jgi:hypothetical protein
MFQVALVNVVHIKDSVCTLPTSILAQYLKQANGQLSCLKVRICILCSDLDLSRLYRGQQMALLCEGRKMYTVCSDLDWPCLYSGQQALVLSEGRDICIVYCVFGLRKEKLTCITHWLIVCYIC